MGWLPTSVLLTLGVVALILLLVSTVGAAHRARNSARRLNVALAGRLSRLRAGAAEITTWWVDRRRAGRGDGMSARDA